MDSFKSHTFRQPDSSEGRIDSFTFSCIDYRFDEHVRELMRHIFGMDATFDSFTLAGASLGVNKPENHCWPLTFYNTTDLSISLHNPKNIIALDHEQCGYYRAVYGPLSPEKEDELHIKNLKKLQRKICKKYQDISFQGWILKLDGTFVRIV